jgi:hypothetical protein
MNNMNTENQVLLLTSSMVKHASSLKEDNSSQTYPLPVIKLAKKAALDYLNKVVQGESKDDEGFNVPLDIALDNNKSRWTL